MLLLWHLPIVVVKFQEIQEQRDVSFKKRKMKSEEKESNSTILYFIKWQDEETKKETMPFHLNKEDTGWQIKHVFSLLVC